MRWGRWDSGYIHILYGYIVYARINCNHREGLIIGRKKGLVCVCVCVCAHNKRVLFTFPGPPVSCEKAPTSSIHIHIYIYTSPQLALFCLRLNDNIYTIYSIYKLYNTSTPCSITRRNRNRVYSDVGSVEVYIYIYYNPSNGTRTCTRFNYFNSFFFFLFFFGFYFIPLRRRSLFHRVI